MIEKRLRRLCFADAFFARCEPHAEVYADTKKIGIKNEIDLIAISSLDRQVTVAEVECNHKKKDMSILKEKAKQIWTLFPRYKRQTVGLSLEDM